MNRFDDDLVFAKPGEPPHTVGALLGDLGVFAEPYEIQRAAVSEWLKSHRPTDRFMRDELIDRGLLARDRRDAA